jgi:hypothetical protein
LPDLLLGHIGLPLSIGKATSQTAGTKCKKPGNYDFFFWLQFVVKEIHCKKEHISLATCLLSKHSGNVCQQTRSKHPLDSLVAKQNCNCSVPAPTRGSSFMDACIAKRPSPAREKHCALHKVHVNNFVLNLLHGFDHVAFSLVPNSSFSYRCAFQPAKDYISANLQIRPSEPQLQPCR